MADNQEEVPELESGSSEHEVVEQEEQQEESEEQEHEKATDEDDKFMRNLREARITGIMDMLEDMDADPTLLEEVRSRRKIKRTKARVEAKKKKKPAKKSAEGDNYASKPKPPVVMPTNPYAANQYLSAGAAFSDYAARGSIFHSMVGTGMPNMEMPSMGYEGWAPYVGAGGGFVPQFQNMPGVALGTGSQPTSIPPTVVLAPVYDGLAPMGPPTAYNEGGASVKFDTFDGASLTERRP